MNYRISYLDWPPGGASVTHALVWLVRAPGGHAFAEAPNRLAATSVARRTLSRYPSALPSVLVEAHAVENACARDYRFPAASYLFTQGGMFTDMTRGKALADVPCPWSYP